MQLCLPVRQRGAGARQARLTNPSVCHCHRNLSCGPQLNPDMQLSKKIKETPPSPKRVSKPAQMETTMADVSARCTMAMQNLNPMENPWAGITLDRCLLVAVIIIFLSSGIQSLQEALGAFVEEGVDLGQPEDNTPEKYESSLWGNVFWWNQGSEDDDDADNEEDLGVRSTKRLAREDFARIKHVEKPGKRLGFEGSMPAKRKDRRVRQEEEIKEEVRAKRERRVKGGDREDNDDDDDDDASEEEEGETHRRRKHNVIQKREDNPK